MKKIKVLLLLCTHVWMTLAQTGGDNTYEFLNLVPSARTAALGNVLVNALDDDVNLALILPSLNNKKMNGQFSVNYTSYYDGISYGSFVFGLPHKKFENILVGMHYVNYGTFIRTDEFGYQLGNFSSGEYALLVSTAIRYNSNIRIGATLKGVYSNFETYNSYGLSSDMSITYSKERMHSSILIKNLGYQLKSFSGSKEPLPVEVIIGVTNKLEHAPLRWSITWSHLEKWDLSYQNKQDELYDPFTGETTSVGTTFRDKLVSHLHVGAELLFSKNFNFRLGYNFKRRQELALDLYKHGVGLSWGFAMKVKKIHVNFARLPYHAVGPLHTFSITSNIGNFWNK